MASGAKRSASDSKKADFFDVVAARYSVRAYQKREVEPDLLRKILEAANLAPSAGNLQAYEIVVVRDVDRKKALAEAAVHQTFIAEAPVVMVFLANPARSQWRYGRRGAQLYCIQDATISCAYAQLAAAALGLGSCWVGAFYEKEILKAIDCSYDLIPVALLTIGWSAEPFERRPRRSLSDLVHYERCP